MNILTFGSCLSRFTANQYCRIFGGKVISSVYQNRSDSFVGNYIDYSLESFKFEELEPFLALTPTSSEEFGTLSIVKDQLKNTVGLHVLPNREGLFDTLGVADVDIIIADNFVDIGARLMYRENNINKKIFLRKHDINNFDNSWRTTELLSVEEGVCNMGKVLKYFRSFYKDAYIVFINFPCNTYYESPKRVERTLNYQDKFNLDMDKFLLLKSLDVPAQYQTNERQHYTSEHYAYCAGMIYSFINNFK